MIPPSPPLSPTALALAEAMAGVFADRFIQESLLPQLSQAARQQNAGAQELLDTLRDPFGFLHIYYGHYAFAKRGHDRLDLSSMATAALRRIADSETFLRHANEQQPLPIWQAFSGLCAERGRKENPQLNQSALEGMMELTLGLAGSEGVSVPSWIEAQIRSTGRADEVFERIVNLKGVGPKAASVLLRDLAHFFQLEEVLHPADRLLILPVDKWVRECARLVVPEASERSLADWLIAGKMAKFSRQAEVSVVRFSMGLSWFGQHHVSSKTSFQDALERHLLS